MPGGCGGVEDGWAGWVCGRVGEMGGAVVAVGLVDDEGGCGVRGALCLRGLCRWRSRLVARVCVPVLAHVRVCVHVLDRVLTKIADEGTERMDVCRVVGRRHRTAARPRTVGGR